MSNSRQIPIFGARKFAAQLLSEIDVVRGERDSAIARLKELDGMSLLDIKEKIEKSQLQLANLVSEIEGKKLELDAVRQQIVETEDLAMLQESGIYSYSHPLTDAVAFQKRLGELQRYIKAMNGKDGGAITSATSWTVNGSEAKGRAMVREMSKLMLRAFNAEADNLVRSLKPYKVDASVERLEKVAATIERLGKTMQIQIAHGYLQLRTQEIQLTGDFLQKMAEEKEEERAERERLKEERKAQQELERERQKLEKERQHYLNALAALRAKGDDEGAARLQAQLDDVDKAIENVDYRAANIRAGYVYVISNIGSFGDSIVKVGMTRRLDPMDRIRELSDASVPFNFDVHALFFSDDAVGIETAMHNRLADVRCNLVNLRREFFHATAMEAKLHLAELTGELLTFHDLPEAIEYRQSVEKRKVSTFDPASVPATEC